MSRRRDHKRGESPYRRRKTPSPEDMVETPREEAEEGTAADNMERGPSLEPGQMAQLIVDMRNGLVDQQAAHAIQAPLQDLAKAFAMQAEILRGVHETQVELTETLRRDKKAEMMVNATDSLNETFKGVRRTQQQLLDELEDRGRRSRWSLWWILAASAVLMATTLGLFWWKDSRDQKLRLQEQESLRSEVAAKYDALFASRAADSESTAGEWKDLARKTLEDLRQVEGEKNRLLQQTQDLSARLAELEKSAAEDRSRLQSLRHEMAQKDPELKQLRHKVGALEENLSETLARLEASRKEAEHLREEVIARLNRSNVERMVKKTEDEASREPVIPPIKTVAALEAAPGAKPGGGLKPGQSMEAVIDDLNELMSQHRGSQVYRIQSVGRIGPHHLEDVVLTESGPRSGVIKKIRARKLDVTISGRGDLVEMNFMDGEVQQKRTSGTMGPWTKFYNGRYRLTIYCLNGEKWMARPYTFFVVN